MYLNKYVVDFALFSHRYILNEFLILLTFLKAKLFSKVLYLRYRLYVGLMSVPLKKIVDPVVFTTVSTIFLSGTLFI